MSRVREPPPARVVRWAAHQVHPGAVVLATTRLEGGISAAMDRITVRSPEGLTDVVLRRWPDEPWAAGLVAREAAALEAVSGHGIPVPRLLARDEDGTQTGVRCTLTSALTGEPDLTPADRQSWLGRLAGMQAAIHDVPPGRRVRRHGWGGDEGEALAPDRYGARHRSLAWLADAGLRDAAQAAAEGPLAGREVLVHGDYQHFNVLWSDGELTGVVDWPNAGIGHRGSDVGHCRLNLAVLFDSRTADDYLIAYEQAAGAPVDQRADLRALLCFDLAWPVFIPQQVAGRADVDVAGMAARVTAAVRSALDRIG